MFGRVLHSVAFDARISEVEVHATSCGACFLSKTLGLSRSVSMRSVQCIGFRGCISAC